MVMTMQTHNHTSNIIELISGEFNGQYFYGLELILDELYDDKEHQSKINPAGKVDWFGLSDLCI